MPSLNLEQDAALKLLSKVFDHDKGAIEVDFPGLQIIFTGKLGKQFLSLCRKALEDAA